MNTPLFWSERFLASHMGNYNIMKVKCVSEYKNREFEVILPYKKNGEQFLSPGEATFGGFWVTSDEPLSESEFYRLINNLKNDYSGLSFVWKFPPEHISNLNFYNQYNAIRGNFNFTEVSDVNQHLEVPNWSYESLSYGNIKKLKQFINVKGRIIEGDSGLIESSISVIEFSRIRKGLKLTMQRSHLINNLSNLKDEFRVYSASIHDEVVGAAITVDIGFSTRYVLYWGDNEVGRKYSVTASLCEAIVKSAKLDLISKVDLGVSSLNGITDAGLYRFKQNLGAIDSHRKTLTF
jgi:hypothetical protein